MLKYLKIAMRNILTHKKRSLLIGGAIIIVTIIFILLTSLFSGIQKNIIDFATTLMSGHINVAGVYKPNSSTSAPIIPEYQKVKNLLINNLPEITGMTLRMESLATILNASISKFFYLAGINIEEQNKLVKQFLKFKGDISQLKHKGSIALYKKDAKDLGISVGDQITVFLTTMKGVNNTKDLKVCAIIDDIGMATSNVALVNIDDLRDINLLKDNTISTINIYTNLEKYDITKLENKIRSILAKNGYQVLPKKKDKAYYMLLEEERHKGWTGKKLIVTTWEDESAAFSWIVTIYSAVTFVFIIILMIIIVVGLMNTMWMNIRERTTEIGTMRAIGMKKSGIMFMFLLESMLLSTVSVLIGVTLGIGLVYLLDYLHITIPSEAFSLIVMSDKLVFNIEYSNIISAFLVIIILVTIGSLYPSYRASKMDPIKAINFIS